MNLKRLAAALGGSVNGEWVNIRGPGHGAADRSLGFKLDRNAPDGFWLNTFAGDDPLECRQHVRERLKAIVNDWVLLVEPSTGVEKSRGRVAKALALWAEASTASGTIVEEYVLARGCELSTVEAEVIRFHPKCPFGNERVPAMIALMRDIRTDEPKGILRTALKDDGSGKRPMAEGFSAKMMLGHARDAAIKLQLTGTALGIAEGIESALSASKLFGVPTWAVMSAGGIAQFPIVPAIEHLTVFADHDDAGVAAARKCGARYGGAGIRGEIRFPDRRGSDWNRELMGE
jgi:putative DNA primase/helicase